MAKVLTGKRRGTGIEMKTFIGKGGENYLVFRTGAGSYHVFVEVEAKEAARECGAAKGANTRTEWKSLWES